MKKKKHKIIFFTLFYLFYEKQVSRMSAVKFHFEFDNINVVRMFIDKRSFKIYGNWNV